LAVFHRLLPEFVSPSCQLCDRPRRYCLLWAGLYLLWAAIRAAPWGEQCSPRTKKAPAKGFRRDVWFQLRGRRGRPGVRWPSCITGAAFGKSTKSSSTSRPGQTVASGPAIGTAARAAAGRSTGTSMGRLGGPPTTWRL